MKHLLNKYCEHGTGLFLLNLPTGFGKTYQVLKYILNHHSKNRPIYFVTNLKKNLPLDELRQLFREEGIEKTYDDLVLFIDGTAVQVIENITNLPNVPEEIKKWEEYKKLKHKARFVRSYQNSKQPGKTQAEAANIIVEEIRVEWEPKFRNKLIKYIELQAGAMEKYVSTKRKLAWIEQNASWIISLYPSVTSIQKRIFFMSVDKFFARNVTLIEPSYYFHEHKSMDKALVFLDEFDASKAPLLNMIIRNGLNKRIDLVALFQQIYTSFQTLQFPSGLRQESNSRKQALEKNIKQRTVADIIDHLKRESIKITERFHLDAPFKTVNPDNRRNFIFHDFQYQSILKEGYNFIRLEYDEKHLVNKIHFEQKQKNKEGISLLHMLAALRAYIQYFAKGVWMIAMNYQSIKEENGEQDFPLESAIRSVFDLYNLSSLQVNYLLDNIANYQIKVENEGLPNSNYLREHSFYMNGFRYYDFVDGDTHDLTSRIFMCSFDVTPEKLLLKLATKANVIGISATATIPTPIGNYDLNFLKQRLRDNYREITEEEYDDLQKQFNELTNGYNQLNIYSQLIHSDANLDSAIGVFEDENFSRELLNELGISKPNRHFFIRRYLRIACAYKYFLNQSQLHSFLYLGNALPKGYNNPDFGEHILEKMFSFLIKKTGVNVWYDNSNKPFISIDSQQFDQKKDQLLQNLSGGHKIFIISTYQTLGAGQNMQYEVPENQKVVQINNRIFNKELKDIDGIYCERPTNLLVNKFGKVLDEEKLVENIFQIEFLAETGELSNSQYQHEIRAGFELISGRRRRINKHDLKEENLYSKESFAQHISKVIIQAIGRMSRTNFKSPSIHILAHKKLDGLIRKAPKSNQIYLREYESLLKICKEPTKKRSIEEEQLYNIAARNDKKAYHIIKGMLNKEFEENNKKFWIKLRDFVIKHPRLESNNQIPLSFLPFYFKLPENAITYQYSKINNQYKSVTESFKGVSDYDCRLYQLMNNLELKNFFLQNNFSTEFGNGQYILTPTAYNSIYKGMLGETVGKYILEKYAYIELNQLNIKEYEQFDFKTDNNVYIDFKHWFTHDYTDTGLEYENIQNKLEKVGAEKALIINLIGSNNYKEKKQKSILEIPYLIDESSKQVSNNMIQKIVDFIYN